MSGRIEVEHRGYRLAYGENSDTWTCYDLGVENASLAKAKAAIDKLLLKARKGAKFVCLELSYSGSAHESEIIEYLGSKVERAFGKTPSREVVTVASMAIRAGRERASRTTGPLDGFIHDTPANRDTLAAASELRRQAQALSRRADEITKAIPRVTKDDIAELIRLRDEGVAEGEQTLTQARTFG